MPDTGHTSVVLTKNTKIFKFNMSVFQATYDIRREKEGFVVVMHVTVGKRKGGKGRCLVDQCGLPPFLLHTDMHHDHRTLFTLLISCLT